MPNEENHVDEGGDKSEVVVTEAMIEAGVYELRHRHIGEPLEGIVEEIFRVMAITRLLAD